VRQHNRVFMAVLSVIALLLPVCSFAVLPVMGGGRIINLITIHHPLKSQYLLLIAQYVFGRLVNGAQDLKNQQWLSDHGQHSLQGLSGSHPARYQELVQHYQQNHPYFKNYHQLNSEYDVSRFNIAQYGFCRFGKSSLQGLSGSHPIFLKRSAEQ